MQHPAGHASLPQSAPRPHQLARLVVRPAVCLVMCRVLCRFGQPSGPAVQGGGASSIGNRVRVV